MTKYNTLFPAKYLQDRLLLSSLNIEDIEGKLSVVERWKNEIDTKSICIILKNFKKFLNENYIPPRNTNDMRLVLEEIGNINSDSQELSRNTENGKNPNGCL